MKSSKQELIGELFSLSKLPIVGFFPIILNHATRLMPPVLFAGLSSLVAAACILAYLLATGQTIKIINKKSLPYILGITLFIIIIPSIFIFVGASMTSGINTSILMQTELLFTFLVCGVFLREKIHMQKILGGLLMILGATSVLYNGSFSLNSGDLLIILGTAFYPFGNIFNKKAIKFTSIPVIIFVRSLLGGAALILISLFFEKFDAPFISFVQNNIGYIFLNGIFIYGISKMLGYEALKRLDISKTIAIGIATPAVSLIYAFLFLKEIPSIYQLVGFFVIVSGLFIITRKKTEVAVEIN